MVFMIVTPRRDIFVGVCFAVSQAISALIFALLILKVASAALQETLQHTSAVITDWGPIALAMLSIFPDIPRASITAATVVNISTGVIACSVLVGKLVLYLAVASLLRNSPRLIAAMRTSKFPLVLKMYPKLRRLAAFQRLMRR